MNGIDKIIAHIKADSDAECAAIRAEAAKKCNEILARCENEAAAEYEKITGKGAQDAEKTVDRLVHAAELESKKQLLAVKQQLLSLAFDRAVHLLTELPEKEYVALLARLAAESSRTGDEQIILSESDSARIGAAVCKRANKILSASGKPASLTLSERTGNIRGGLILSSGDIEVNCSAETLAMRYKNRLAAQVAGLLFD